MRPGLRVTFPRTHAVFLMVLHIGYIEDEIVFLPIWLKRNHPKENVYGRTTRGKQRPQKHREKMSALSGFGPVSPHPVVGFYTCIHSLRKKMHFLPRMPLEDDAAPRWLITSGQGQEPAVGKPHGATQQLVLASSICWHQTVIFSSTQVLRSFVGQKALWWLCNQLSFNRPFARTESKSNLRKAISSLQVKHCLLPLLMPSLWKWCPLTRRKFRW